MTAGEGIKGQRRRKCTRRKNGSGNIGQKKKQRIFWNRKRDLSLSCLWRRLTFTRLSSCFHKTTPNSLNGLTDGVDQGLFALPTFTFFKCVIHSAHLWENTRSCDPITKSQTSVCITKFNSWRFSYSGVGFLADW